MGSFTFCHPAILQFLIAAISFLIECKELQLAQTAPLTRFFNFEPNLYLQRRLLWVTWQNNEQQCTQSSEQGFLYRERKILLLFPSLK